MYGSYKHDAYQVLSAASVPGAATVTSVIRMSATGERGVCLCLSGPRQTFVSEPNVVILVLVVVIILLLEVWWRR